MEFVEDNISVTVGSRVAEFVLSGVNVVVGETVGVEDIEWENVCAMEGDEETLPVDESVGDVVDDCVVANV